MTRTLVLGIGNTLLGDEGAGVHVLNALRSRTASSSSDIEFLDGGTLSFTLAAPIGASRALLVLDAAQLDAEPGTVQLFEGEDMDRYLGGHRRASVHEVGLIDLMAMVRLTDTLPPQRALLGIQPRDVDWSESPSGPVAAAIPRACDLALDLLARWRA